MSTTVDGAGKYELIAAELQQRIDSGTYAPGDSLPAAGTLAQEFGAAVKTIQRALRHLDELGLTIGRQGSVRRVVDRSADASATRYQEVAAAIRRSIDAGDLPRGGRLPPEHELMDRYEVARATVRTALDLLETSGEIVKRAGRRYIAGQSNESDLAYERVASEMQKRIVAGAYVDGKLPGENALATQFGVSRPTIRQALNRLRATGLVRSEPKQGWFVAGPTKED